MPRINLLPWREELRKRQQKEFGLTALAAAVLALLAVVAVHFEMQDRIDFQRERNTYLETQIALLDRKIKEIQDLENEKARLLARMRLIGVAQSNARVSSLMRNLDSSRFLGEPSLVEIKARNPQQPQSAGLRLSDFAMNVSKKKRPPPGGEG